MPMPAGALNLMRSHPQMSDTYLVIQQPEQRTPGLYAVWIDYEWSCQVNGNPVGDPIATITVDGGDAGPVNLLDGMTVMIGSVRGDWDKGIIRLRGDQVVNAGTVALDIATSSDITGVVEDDDWIVVLDEFRLWQRYGYITVAGGVVTWYKDWDILWTATGANDAARRLASMPPVPIMGPHAVVFLDPGETALVDFDWSDSYANAPAQTVAAWASVGETDHIGGTWNSAAQNPPPQAYNIISGLAGFRVTLEVNDGNGNAATLPFRRGIRYVFTLRRPGQSRAGDPWNAEPIIQFSVGDVVGSFQQGYHKAQITVYGEDANKYTIIPGALVILFTEDVYQGHDQYLSDYGPISESVGPIDNRENIMMVGRIADDSIEYDTELETVTFDVISHAEEAARDTNYPIVINDAPAATDWIETVDLTVDRAIRYYTAWHTTLTLIADFYRTGDARLIKAMDFMEGDIYSTIDSFLQSRLFGRLLCDRFGRFICEIDVQMQAFGSVPTLWVLDNDDWVSPLGIRQSNDAKANYTELGGVRYVGGNAVPFKSGAPGTYDKYAGRPTTSMSLAIDNQDQLNVMSGRLLAYLNREYEIDIDLAGNWRVSDIVPQESVYLEDLDTVRGILSGRFIIREVTRRYDQNAGAWFTSITCEPETVGTDGLTIEIPGELPDVPGWRPPRWPTPPSEPPGGGGGAGARDGGRRMIATDQGVFVIDNILADTSIWYQINVGFASAADMYAYDIKRDAWHWWTTDGDERTLWAGTRTGIWRLEGFPTGTWEHIVTLADIEAASGVGLSSYPTLWYFVLDFTIEVENRFAFACYAYTSSKAWHFYAVVQDGVITDIISVSGNYNYFHRPDIRYAQHSGAAVAYCSRGYIDPFVNSTLYRWIIGVSFLGTGAGLGRIADPRISLPYVNAGNDDQYMYCGGVDRWRYTSTGGAVWADKAGVGAGFIKLGTGGTFSNIWIMESTLGDISRWSNDDGATWNDLPANPIHPFESLAEWSGDVLHSVLIGDLSGNIYYWEQGLGIWVNKTGNLGDFGVSVIEQIQRDTMGAA